MALMNLYDRITRNLDHAGDYIWPLLLRVILFWEFWEAGVTKFNGENWFASIPWADWQKGFPFPFNAISTDLNWFLATWGELVLSVMLLLGLFTRFTAFSLIIVTAVATVAVHWPAEWNSLGELWEGYVITTKTAGNFKLPLLFVLMLLPLVFHGGGKVSLDALLLKLAGRDSNGEVNTAFSAGLGLFVLGMTVVFVEPVYGFILLAAAALAVLMGRKATV